MVRHIVTLGRPNPSERYQVMLVSTAYHSTDFRSMGGRAPFSGHPEDGTPVLADRG
jgi:hypothetical protein